MWTPTPALYSKVQKREDVCVKQADQRQTPTSEIIWLAAENQGKYIQYKKYK